MGLRITTTTAGMRFPQHASSQEEYTSCLKRRGLQKQPRYNMCALLLLLATTGLTGLLSQVVQATVDYQLWRDRSSLLTFNLGDIPLLAWLLVSLSPLLVVVVNEVVKLHEIRSRVRYQKRQKLQFETKLGMNSPF